MEMGSIYKDINALKELDADVYLTKRNKIVLSFLIGLAQESVKNLSIRKVFAVNEFKQFYCTNIFCTNCSPISGIPEQVLCGSK